MPKGERLDHLVVERGLIASREAARTAIMDGAVLVNGNKLTKPGMSVPSSAQIELVPGYAAQKFTSRGGLKLEKALDLFNIDVSGMTCLDVGASTGGFTDCLLKRGARLVYAIDVGYGQLDWSLRQDARVVVKERLNARYLTRSIFESESDWAQFAAMDVSFISIMKILPALVSVSDEEHKLELVCLVKPQFEAGRELVGKGGVIRSPQVHEQVLESIDSFAKRSGIAVLNWSHSPIKGPAGNIEFLVHLRTHDQPCTAIELGSIVQDAHDQLNR